MNRHWMRWVRASILKHFETNRQGVHLFIEGGDRDTSGNQNFAELRVDGPFLRENSKNCWDLTVEINVLIQGVLDKDDLYKIEEPIGIMCAAFHRNITVYKYGEGNEDDQSILGCLQILVNDSEGDGIMVSRFGQIEADTNIEQATVEAHYRMRLIL